ncbi:MAG: hypothetical protein EA362_12930 [Saprospirales bacterium]|nr:MAG: hypothetical protein EA362_12930 [Saprospirales bacterium]
MAAQGQVDTIDVEHTFLEDRHLRYMYNYALNAALFQYQSGIFNTYSYSGIKNHIVGRKNFYLILDRISPKIEHLENFVLPAKFCHLTYLIGSQEKALQLPIMTQYKIKFYSSSKTERSQIISAAYRHLLDDDEARFYGAFSGLYRQGKQYYLELVIGYHQYFNPIKSYLISYIFEFEWCDMRKIMYPMRTVDKDFYFALEQNIPTRFSRTVIIPAKVCPN